MPIGVILEFYWGYIGIMGKKMERRVFIQEYAGVCKGIEGMEQNMETTSVLRKT